MSLTTFTAFTSSETTSTSLSTTPLLTFFSAPTTCDPTSISTWTSCASSSGTWTCAPYQDDDCLPAPSSKLSTIIFSPGVCPSQYYAAGFSGLPNAATTAWCCPSGCIYNSGSCASQITGAYRTASATSGSAAATELVAATTTEIATFIGLFPTVQVAWASSDMNSFTPASAPVLQAQATSFSPTSSSSDSAGLSISDAAKAGIGVGVGLAVLIALVAFACWWFWRQRQHSKHRVIQEAEGDGKVELPGNSVEMAPRYPYAELGHEGTLSELDVRHKAVEMEGPVFRHELEGDFTPVEVHGNAPPIGVVFPRLEEKPQD